MLHVNALVKDLAKSHRDGFKDAEGPVKQWQPEIGSMDEVVGDAVDVP